MLIICTIFGGLAVIAGLTWLLIRYGETLEKVKAGDEKLQTEIKMHDSAKDVALNSPISDDDVLAGLRRPD